MYNYNEIKPRNYILHEGQPYEVLSTHVFRKQQRKPVNQTKLKNLITGKVVEHSFHQSDKIEEADMSVRDITYQYNNKGEWWFSDPENPRDRFIVSESTLGEQGRFLKEKTTVQGLVFEDEIIGIRMPIKVVLEVTEAPPNIKGNTATGGNKPVTLETGAVVTTPMFIETGDMIEVNTESGEYVQRANDK